MKTKLISILGSPGFLLFRIIFALMIIIGTFTYVILTRENGLVHMTPIVISLLLLFIIFPDLIFEDIIKK